MEPKKCAICSNMFAPKAGNQITCSTACQKERSKIHMKNWRHDNVEDIKAKKRAYYQANKDKIRQYHKDWRLRHLEVRRKLNRRSVLKCAYGLTAEKYNEIFIGQNSRCPICKTDSPTHKRAWHVDHCHESGKVRGILCGHCNIMLGHARDKISTLRAAIVYLKGN